MYAASRLRLAAIALLVGASLFAWTAAGSSAVARTSPSARTLSSASGSSSVKRFSLAGYVIDTQYSRGRNAGNTFEQT